MECVKSEPNSDLEDGEIRDDDFEDISEGSLSELAESRRDLASDNATADPPTIPGSSSPVDDLNEEEKYRLEALKSLLENTETNDENEEEQYRLEALKSLLEREKPPDNTPLNSGDSSKKRKKRKRANMNRRKRRKQEKLKASQSGESINMLQETTTFLAQLAIDIKESNRLRKNVEKTEKTVTSETEPVPLENANVSDSQNRSWCPETEIAVTLQTEQVLLEKADVYDSQNRSWYPKTSWESDDMPTGGITTAFEIIERMRRIEESMDSGTASPNNCIHNTLTEQREDSEMPSMDTTSTLSSEPMNVEEMEKDLHLESEPQKCEMSNRVHVEKNQVQTEQCREFYFEDRNGDFQTPPPPPVVQVQTREVHSTIPEKSKYKLRYSRVQPEPAVPNKQPNLHTVPKYAAATSANRVKNNASVDFSNRNVYKKVAASMVPPTSSSKFPIQKHRQGKYKLNNVNKSKYVFRKELLTVQQHQGTEHSKKSSVYSVNHMKTNFPEVNPKEFIIPLDEEDSSKEEENKENPPPLKTPRTIQSPKSNPCRVKAANEGAQIPRTSKEKPTQAGEKEKEAMRSKILSVLGSKNVQLRESEELTGTKKVTKDSLKKNKKEEEAMRSKILSILGSKSTESVCRDTSCQVEDININPPYFRLLQPEGEGVTIEEGPTENINPPYRLLQPEGEELWSVKELTKNINPSYSRRFQPQGEDETIVEGPTRAVPSESTSNSCTDPEAFPSPSQYYCSKYSPMQKKYIPVFFPYGSDRKCTPPFVPLIVEPQMALPRIVSVSSESAASWPMVAEQQSESPKLVEPPWSVRPDRESERNQTLRNEEQSILVEYEQHLRPEIIKIPSRNEPGELGPLAERSASENSGFRMISSTSFNVHADQTKMIYAEPQGWFGSDFLMSENQCQTESEERFVGQASSSSDFRRTSSNVHTDQTKMIYVEPQGPSFSDFHRTNSIVDTDTMKIKYLEPQGPSVSDFHRTSSIVDTDTMKIKYLEPQGPSFSDFHRTNSNVHTDQTKMIYAEPQGPSVSDFHRTNSIVDTDTMKMIYAEHQGPFFSDFRVSENQCQMRSEERFVGQAQSSSDSHISENLRTLNASKMKKFCPRIRFIEPDGRVRTASSQSEEIQGVVRAQCADEMSFVSSRPIRGITYLRRHDGVFAENRFQGSSDPPYSTPSEAGTSTTTSMNQSRRITANSQNQNIPSSSKAKLQSEEVTSVKHEPNDEVVIKSEPIENVEQEELPRFQSVGDSITVDPREDWLDFRNDIHIDASDEHLLKGLRVKITPKKNQMGIIRVRASEPVQPASRTEATENKNDRAFLSEAEENLIRIRTKLVQDLDNLADSVNKNKQESVKFSVMDKKLKSLKATIKKLEEELEGQRLRLRMSNSVVRSFYDGIELRSRTCSRLKELCTTIGRKTMGPEYKPPNTFEDMIVKRRQSFNGFNPDDLFPTKL